MSKLILKTAASTLIAILLLMVLGFTILSLVFPSTMSEVCISFDLTGMASRYSVLVYERSGNVKDIGAATEYAIYAGEDRLVVSCAERLIADEAFDDYVEYRSDGTYDYLQYLYGKYAVAEYRTGKADEAIETAFSVLEPDSFPTRNAVISLSIAIISEHDGSNAAKITAKLNEVRPDSAEEAEDLENIIALLKEITNE